MDKKKEKSNSSREEKKWETYGVESGVGVDGEQGNLIYLGAEDGELRGGEIEAAVTGRELCLAGGGVEPDKGHPEGEVIPMLDPRAARLADAIHVRCC
jgi:hypothetical protein